MNQDRLRASILKEVSRFAEVQLEKPAFIRGESAVPVSGKVLFPADYEALVDASLDGWLTAGRFHDSFQRALSKYVGARNAIFVNSGSSANLVALSALTSPRLGKKRLLPGDEVITVAAGFPTTVNPIIQNGLRPVVVDIELGTYDAISEQLKEAVGPKTRAIMMAHTLGNPFDLDTVRALCKEHGLWLVEDACDSLGSTYDGQKTGSFGDTATLSFYPAHHITTGEGGAVFVKSPLVRKQVESFRDWGRDCYCETGHDNTCHKRFEWQLGDLPLGYDHKYIYSHIGYNLKATDMQAALGLSQLKNIDAFTQARKDNFKQLYKQLEEVEGLILPKATPKSDPSWFGFMLLVRESAPFTRTDVARHMESSGIGNRMLFGGNLVRQPVFHELAGRRPGAFRSVGSLAGADAILNRALFIGVYPGLNCSQIEYVIDQLRAFAASAR